MSSFQVFLGSGSFWWSKDVHYRDCYAPAWREFPAQPSSTRFSSKGLTFSSFWLCLTKIVDGDVRLARGWCAGRNPPSVRDGIQLYGLPASRTETHRRLFALSPCRSAVSTLPSGDRTMIRVKSLRTLDGNVETADLQGERANRRL